MDRLGGTNVGGRFWVVPGERLIASTPISEKAVNAASIERAVASILEDDYAFSDPIHLAGVPIPASGEVRTSIRVLSGSADLRVLAHLPEAARQRARVLVTYREVDCEEKADRLRASVSPRSAEERNTRIAGINTEIIHKMREEYHADLISFDNKNKVKPCINAGTLRAELANDVAFRNLVIDGLITADSFMEVVASLNGAAREKYPPRIPFPLKSPIPKNVEKTQFFLGLDRGWVADVCARLRRRYNP